MRTGAEEKWAALSAAVLEIAPLVSVFSVACNFLHGFERQIRELLEANGHAAAMFVYVSHSRGSVAPLDLWQDQLNVACSTVAMYSPT